MKNTNINRVICYLSCLLTCSLIGLINRIFLILSPIFDQFFSKLSLLVVPQVLNLFLLLFSFCRTVFAFCSNYILYSTSLHNLGILVFGFLMFDKAHFLDFGRRIQIAVPIWILYCKLIIYNVICIWLFDINFLSFVVEHCREFWLNSFWV